MTVRYHVLVLYLYLHLYPLRFRSHLLFVT